MNETARQLVFDDASLGFLSLSSSGSSMQNDSIYDYWPSVLIAPRVPSEGVGVH